MSKALYVLQYENGDWVQRDDSTGPMSTGGYPSPVKELSEATWWYKRSEALRYRHTMGQPWTLHRLGVSATPEVITPADEAEARGDKEFAEYQRLAKKFGKTGIGECPFVVAWVGKCKKTPDVGELFCENHKGVKCYKCGAQATSDCGHTSQFVCGTPQCDIHNRHHG